MSVDNEIYGKGSGSGTLPAGFVDSNGIVHNQIYLKEMTGAVEDELDNSELSATDRISRVLVMCTEKLGTITDKKVIEAAISDNLAQNGGLPLTAQDRIAAMLLLRRISLGDVYSFEKRCPRCGENNKNKSINLKDIAITPVKDPSKRRVKVTLPRTNKVAILKVLAAKGEAQVLKLKPNQKDLKSCAIMARLESVGDRTITGSSDDVAFIRDLPKVDRDYIVNIYQVMEGNIDTNIQVICKNALCGIEFEFPIDLTSLFFLNQAAKPTLEDLTWV